MANLGIYQNTGIGNTCPGIAVVGCTFVRVFDNYINNSPVEAGIEIFCASDTLGSKNVIVSGNTITNSNKGVAVNRWGAASTSLSDTIVISNNTINNTGTTQDGIRVGYTNDSDAFKNVIIANNNIVCTRYGIYTVSAASTANRIYNLSIIGNHVYSNTTPSYGIYITRTNNCNVKNNYFETVTYDVDIDAYSNVTVMNNQFSKFYSSVGGIYSLKNNAGYKTEADVLSSTFAIDSTGIKTVTIAHGLAITPAVQDCYLTVVQNTAVDDWAYNFPFSAPP